MTAPHNNSPSRFSFAAERRKSTPFLAMSLSFQTRHSLAVLFLADVFVAFATEVTGCWVIRRDHSPPFSQRDRCVFDPASTHKTPASWPPGPALTHLRPTCVADHVVHTSPSFRPVLPHHASCSVNSPFPQWDWFLSTAPILVSSSRLLHNITVELLVTFT